MVLIRTAMALMCGLLLLQPGAPAHARQPDFTLEDIHQKGRFAGRTFPSGTWDREGPRQWMAEPVPGAPIVLKDLVTGREKWVVDGKEVRDPVSGLPLRVESVEPSPDGRWLLLFSDSEQVWRQRSKGRWHVFDLEKRTLHLVSETARFAMFSPSGNALAFFRDRDLIVLDMSSGREIRLTGSGGDEGVINGASDWVHEEELGVQRAFAWSPDGTRLAWLQLDERQVSEVRLTDGRAFRYPKAGERNAEARICTTRWREPDLRCLDLGTWDTAGEDGTASDPSRPEYLARMGWTGEPEARIWVLRLNRAQDRVDLLAAHPVTGRVDTLHTELSASWIKVTDRTVTFLPNGEQFLWLGSRDGWQHLDRCHIRTRRCEPVTAGAWEIADLLGIDPDGEQGFFTSAMGNPLERHVFRVNLRQPEAKPVRLTPQPGVHAADLSPDGQWFVDRHSDARTPMTWTIRSTSSGRSWPLEENHALRKLLGRMALPDKQFISLPAADGTPLDAWILKPSRFDSTRSWPVLFYVYGGPDAQTVTDSWDQGVQRQVWHAWLAETLGLIVVSVDPRGAGGRGRDFAGQVKGQLGPVVAADLAAAARHLAAQPWVDEDRIGIWGWSYGGYATLMALLGTEDSPFRIGVAIAPVTDWRLYDTIYSERYLSTPQVAPLAYDASSVLTHAARLRDDQQVLLVHGDADDNVHLEHTLALVEAFQQANRQFDLMIYPGRTHSLSGQGTRLHLFSMISRYIEANLVRTLQEADPLRFAPE